MEAELGKSRNGGPILNWRRIQDVVASPLCFASVLTRYQLEPFLEYASRRLHYFLTQKNVYSTADKDSGHSSDHVQIASQCLKVSRSKIEGILYRTPRLLKELSRFLSLHLKYSMEKGGQQI